MGLPCFSNPFCTATLDTDIDGKMFAEAHIVRSEGLPSGVIEPIDASAGMTTVLNRQRYRTRRRSTDADTPGFMTADTITDSHALTNPFACDAYGLLVFEFRVRGNINDSGFANRGDNGGAPDDADFNDTDLNDHQFYIRAQGQLEFNGLAPAQLLTPKQGGTPPVQISEFDQYGVWVPASAGIRDQAAAGFNEALSPTNTNGTNDNIWQQTALVKLTAGQGFVVDATLWVIEKWHFDMSDGIDTDGGAQLRGGTIYYWPADD